MAWRDTNFGALPPSYDDVIAAGSSVLVRGGGSSSLSRQNTPFTLATPSTTPFAVIPEADDLNDFNNPELLESTSPVVQQQPPPRITRTTPNSGGNHSNRTPRPSVTRATPTGPVTTTANQTQSQRLRPSRQSVTRYRLSLIDQLALFSMPNIMLNGLTLPKIEVDPEARVPNRRAIAKVARTTEQIRMGCGCFWFFGFTILFLLVAVPVAMILAGLFGENQCPYENNIMSDILFTLGSLLAGLVVIRLIASGMACCKLGNVFGWQRSKNFSRVVLVVEIFFVVIAITYVLLLFIATWFVFSVNTDVSVLSPDYCSHGFYMAAMSLIGISLALFIVIVIYLSVISIFYVLCQSLLVTPTSAKPRQPRQTNR